MKIFADFSARQPELGPRVDDLDINTIFKMDDRYYIRGYDCVLMVRSTFDGHGLGLAAMGEERTNRQSLWYRRDIEVLTKLEFKE